MKTKLLLAFVVSILGVSISLLSQAKEHFGFLTLSHKKNLGDYSVYGDTNFTDVTLDSLKSFGPANLTSTQIAGNLKVFGPLSYEGLSVDGIANIIGNAKGKVGKFAQLSAVGSLDIQATTIDGDTFVTGSLKAKDSQLANISITANTIELSGTTVQNILIRKNEQVTLSGNFEDDNNTSHTIKKHKHQRLVLKNGSIVTGDIAFESGKGIIEKDKSSLIKGKVVGLDTEPLTAQDKTIIQKIVAAIKKILE